MSQIEAGGISIHASMEFVAQIPLVRGKAPKALCFFVSLRVLSYFVAHRPVLIGLDKQKIHLKIEACFSTS